MKKFSKFFISTIVAMLISSAILSVTPNISEAKKSSLEDVRAQQQELQQQQQQQKQQQNLQTQAVTTQSVSEKKPITTDDIADNAVTSPKIASGGVTTSDVADNTITTSKIANGAVTKEKLAPGTGVTITRTFRIAAHSTTVHPGEVGISDARCNQDEIVTGGGFEVLALQRVVTSEGIFGGAPGEQSDRWHVGVINEDTTDRDFLATAVCLKIVP